MSMDFQPKKPPCSQTCDLQFYTIAKLETTKANSTFFGTKNDFYNYVTIFLSMAVKRLTNRTTFYQDLAKFSIKKMTVT